MDERSIEDSTVLLVKWEIWSVHIDPNDDVNLEQTSGWQTLRVPFASAARVMGGLRYLPVDEMKRNDVFDEKGVYKL